MSNETDLRWWPEIVTPCPANSFNRKNTATMSPAQMRSFEAEWTAWETAHPEDPTGEQYVSEYNERKAELIKAKQDALQEQRKAQWEKQREEKQTTPVTISLQEYFQNRVETFRKSIPMGRPSQRDIEKTRIRLDIPLDVYLAFRDQCTARGVTMSNQTAKLMTQWLSRLDEALNIKIKTRKPIGTNNADTDADTNAPKHSAKP